MSVSVHVYSYVIHLWDMHHDGTWENRSTYTYYTELVLELTALSVEFLHHVHMLVGVVLCHNVSIVEGGYTYICLVCVPIYIYVYV